MLKIVGIMLLGVFTGYLLKNYQFRWVQKWIMLVHLVIVILIRYCCRYERRDYE